MKKSVMLLCLILSFTFTNLCLVASSEVASSTRPMSYSCPFIGEITGYEKEILNDEIISKVQTQNGYKTQKENFTGEHIKLEITIIEKVNSICNLSVGKKINGTITFWDYLIIGHPELVAIKNTIKVGATIRGEIDSWDLIIQNIDLLENSTGCALEGQQISLSTDSVRGFKNVCCEGLNSTLAFNPENCEELIGSPLRTCIACGDGICKNNVLENNCNCLEDCLVKENLWEKIASWFKGLFKNPSF